MLVGVEIDGNASGAASAAIDGFGVGVGSFRSGRPRNLYSDEATSGSFPLLKDCIGAAIQNYSLPTSARPSGSKKLEP